MTNINTNFDPFANTITPFVEALIKRALFGVHTCIPAIVRTVIDRTKVSVEPAVQQMDADFNSVKWAEIKLPVHAMGGNGIVISAPLKEGDTGWIIAGDLDPSLFFKNKTDAQKQNILTRHDYQFGFFIPDAISDYEISSDDDGGLYIGNPETGTKIVIKGDEIDITSSAALKISGESITINSNDNTSVEIDGVNFKDHVHSAGALTTTATVGSSSVVGTISGETGGVDA